MPVPNLATKTTDYVIAEEAPIGVQLWPTHTPEQAPAFTLMRVDTIRTATHSIVRWTYENGSERTFDIGERIVVKYTPAEGV